MYLNCGRGDFVIRSFPATRSDVAWQIISFARANFCLGPAGATQISVSRTRQCDKSDDWLLSSYGYRNKRVMHRLFLSRPGRGKIRRHQGTDYCPPPHPSPFVSSRFRVVRYRLKPRNSKFQVGLKRHAKMCFKTLGLILPFTCPHEVFHFSFANAVMNVVSGRKTVNNCWAFSLFLVVVFCVFLICFCCWCWWCFLLFVVLFVCLLSVCLFAGCCFHCCCFWK